MLCSDSTLRNSSSSDHAASASAEGARDLVALDSAVLTVLTMDSSMGLIMDLALSNIDSG